MKSLVPGSIKAADKSYYEDHQKRLDDAIVAGWWGEDQDGSIHRQINHKGRIIQK